MTQYEPDGPYVYQPFDRRNEDHWKAGRIYGVGGLPYEATIKGLTRIEADVVCDALRKLVQRGNEDD